MIKSAGKEVKYNDNKRQVIIVNNNTKKTIVGSSGGGSGGGQVDSVNGETGIVVLNQDDVLDGTTYKQFSQTEKIKLGYISVTQNVDLDNIESRVSELDASVILKGSWDASSGIFPGSGVAQAGRSYIVSVGGTVDGVVFAINDRIIAISDNASTNTYTSNWFKADYTDQVLSVFGRTGAITSQSGDYTASQITNTPSGNLSAVTVQEALNELQTDINNRITESSTDDLQNKTLTAPKFADLGFIADANGNEMLIFDTLPSAVNEIRIANAATGNGPTISASGGDTNISIGIYPKGTGAVLIGSQLSSKAGEARFYEASANGFSYISISAAAALAANFNITLPSVDGSAGHALTTNGAGVLSFSGAVNINGPEGFLINGYISRTVASGNLTVAIKTLAGTDPSVANPVWCRIGNTIRSITGALSTTFNAGTNRFNAGGSELATKEIDFFVYLGRTTVYNTVYIMTSRIPHATMKLDFSITTTNEKYANNASDMNSTDEVENIGRFNAILSAGAGFTRSIPATSIIISRPINETMFRTSSANSVGRTTTTQNVYYRLVGSQLTCIFEISGTSNATTASFKLPFSPTIIGPDFSLGLTYDNGAEKTTNGRGTISGNTVTCYSNAASAAWTASGTKIVRGQFTATIQ